MNKIHPLLDAVFDSAMERHLLDQKWYKSWIEAGKPVLAEEAPVYTFDSRLYVKNLENAIAAKDARIKELEGLVKDMGPGLDLAHNAALEKAAREVEAPYMEFSFIEKLPARIRSLKK